MTSARDLTASCFLLLDILARADEDEAARDALLDEASALLDSLAVDVPAKLDALRAVAVRLDAEAALLRAEEQRLAARRKTADRGVERVREAAAELLRAHREAQGPGVLRTTAGSYWLAPSTRLEGPDNVEMWPREWRKLTVSADKAAAKAALEAGREVDGFALVTSESVRWR